MANRPHTPEDMAARREQVRSLTAQGLTAALIAQRMGISARTVIRDRMALGIGKEESRRRMTEEEQDRALELLTDGASYSETARTIGFSVMSVRRRFPGYGMPAGYWWATEVRKMNAAERKTA